MFQEKIERLNEEERLTLLAMTMVSIRGSWTYTEDRGQLIIELCDSLKGNRVISPKDLEDIKDTGEYCAKPDEYFDGREFRDMRANYDYVWKKMGRNPRHLSFTGEAPPNVLEQMKKVYNLILTNLDDLSYDELYEDK